MLAGEPLSGLLEDGGSPANLTLLLSWAVLAARPSESNPVQSTFRLYK